MLPFLQDSYNQLLEYMNNNDPPEPEIIPRKIQKPRKIETNPIKTKIITPKGQ